MWIRKKRLNHCQIRPFPWAVVPSLADIQRGNYMAVIKGKEKKLNKPLSPAKAKLSEKAKKKLRNPRNVQPIPTVAVS